MAYLTGQRPADTLKMKASDIANGFLLVDQGKTQKKLRISVTGELATVLGRIVVRKAQHKIENDQLLMNGDGKVFTLPALRSHFDRAKIAAAKKLPELAEDIKAFRFYDLRAKAADDTSDDRGDQAASDLLGHDNVKTTQRHYLRRGKIVEPTK
ncbi:tyrosine-type recombinase/integrase [Collimonas fungivorans]|nr:tyrosine-type recombinase/integrase [Collimonas fungivorans]